MRTTKAISTISFNSEQYLVLKLNELTKAKKLSFWCFIGHEPEDDECGNKYHYHVYLEPSKMIQTDDIREYLKEFDPNNPLKPRGCLKFVSSDFGNYYMYGLHDKLYLASKGQSRRYHYKHEHYVASDYDDLHAMSKTIDLLSLSPYSAMQDAIKNGVSWEEYFARGTVPLPQIRNFQLAWQTLTASSTIRNGKGNHAMTIDEDTGEVK